MSAGHLPPHLLASFKEAWFKDFGEELSDDEANEQGLGLMEFVMTLAGHPSTVRPLVNKNRIMKDRKKKNPPENPTGIRDGM